MKKLKYKSLTMRIWATFTIIILIIVCSTSLIYLLVYNNINEKAKIQDLKVAHEMLLKNNDYSQPNNQFNQLKNLKGSNYFILNIDGNKSYIIDVNKKDNTSNNMNLNNSTDLNNRPEPPKDIILVHPPQGGMIGDDAKLWMGSFINSSTLKERQFKATYKDMNFIFIISTIDYGSSGKYYLISYAPNVQDNSFLYLVIIIGAVFIGIGFLTAKLVAGYISKPLKELEDYTVKIAHKDWKEPIQIKISDEIGRLADSMNKMRKELKRADEEEKMFLQSISHDLKTPVMVIMSHADALIDGVYIDSPEKTAEIIRDEAIGLEKKIKQMLYLNTLDYVLENNVENDEINLHDLLLHIISRFEVINSEIEWDLKLDKVAAINGNVDKIKVSIENILDNGLRYAKEKISVSLRKEDSYAVIEIFNDGPNIDEAHIDHIFENMYKDKTGNFGLGLAISKKIVDFYNGDIRAVNRENGVSFIIKYPI